VEAVKLGEPESDDEYMAVLSVFSAYKGETVISVEHKRQLWGLLEIHDEEGAVEALDGVDFALSNLPGFYRSRWGEPWAAWPAAMKVAKYLCGAVPSLIAEAMERDLWKSEWHTVHGHQIGKWYIEPETCKQSLEQERPIFDMVFSWCDVEVVDRLNRERALEDEISRLRELLTGIVKDYRLSGHPQLAARLVKKIRIDIPAD